MADQQQFCLRWNNHGSTLVAVFENLLASESLVDVTLFAEGRPFKAHKVVLSACSPYFQTVFAQTRDKHPIVILKDVKHVELAALLDYMYRGEVNVLQDQLGPLIKTAESLKIKGLADGSNKAAEGEAKTSHPPAHDGTKSEKHDKIPATGNGYPAIPVSVPSVLSTVLTMPPALSLASSTFIPPIKLPNTMPDSAPSDESESPHSKKRKRMRRKSGEGGESGDSDGRSASSPGDDIHLPRIPATITPIAHPNHQQQQQQQQMEQERELDREREWEREREREWEREREKEREREREFEEREDERERDRESETNRESKSEVQLSGHSPDNVVGSSRGDSLSEYPRASPYTRPESEPRSNSPTRALSLLVRQDENSGDTNNHSDDYEDRKAADHGEISGTPRPSTSRHSAEDVPQTPKFMWPYAPDQSTSEESSSFSNFENANHDYLRAYNLVRAGFPGLLTPRTDFLVRPPPIGLPLLLKGENPLLLKQDNPLLKQDKGSPKSLLGGYPFSNSPKQFVCEKCGRTYASTGNLKRHKKYECGVEPMFSCPICNKKFQHKHSVKIHLFSTHRNEAGEGGPNDGPPFQNSEGVVGVGTGPCKDEFFPLPQEANAPTTQNQDA